MIWQSMEIIYISISPSAKNPVVNSHHLVTFLGGGASFSPHKEIPQEK